MQAYVEYFQTHGQEYLHMIWQHVYLSLLAVAIAAAIGIPCGILCLRVPKVKKSTDHRIQCITYNTKSCGVGYSDSDYGRWCETGFDSVGYSGNPTNSDPDDTGFFTGSGIYAGSGRCHGNG